MTETLCSVCQMFEATIGSRCESCDGVIRHFLKTKTMNDTIHHDGKGGFETESYRAKKLLMIKARGPHSEYLTQAVLKEAIKTTHFLDTPAGRDWDNIVEWKKAQKSNKTNK